MIIIESKITKYKYINFVSIQLIVMVICGQNPTITPTPNSTPG